MTDPQNDLGYTPRIREISDARVEAQKVSSELYDIIGLHGKVKGSGPGVALCGELDPEKYFSIHHPWALRGVPIEDLRSAMIRLKDDLPKHGWEVKRFGPDKSPAKTLELIADSKKRQFSVNIALWDESEKTGPDAPKSKIIVDLVSACFQVPDGKIVDEY